jgi:palmitoyltransferase
MSVTHIHLISVNLSTVEHMRIRDIKDRESAILSKMFRCWEFRNKGRTKRTWDEEWGGMNTEGNIWWLGSVRKNWESVMGTNILWWICE